MSWNWFFTYSSFVLSIPWMWIFSSFTWVNKSKLTATTQSIYNKQPQITLTSLKLIGEPSSKDIVGKNFLFVWNYILLKINKFYIYYNRVGCMHALVVVVIFEANKYIHMCIQFFCFKFFKFSEFKLPVKRKYF